MKLFLFQMTYILAWSKQSGTLPSKATERNGVLVIPNLQPEDAGTYMCTGSDIMSTDTAVAVLTVSGRYWYSTVVQLIYSFTLFSQLSHQLL